jgi:hypothetical protein
MEIQVKWRAPSDSMWVARTFAFAVPAQPFIRYLKERGFEVQVGAIKPVPVKSVYP